ncbi:flagellar motor protein MotB [bacterium AH-315-L15]|nr:flagellar motor protein MotB [bacterium AH-315-L15]
MGRREDKEEQVDTTAWMATFSDLLSLLLTFFVLLYAMKSLDKGKLDEMLGYFRRGGVGILHPGSRMPLIQPDPTHLKDPGAKPISPADIEKLLVRGKMRAKVGVSSEDRGIVLTISSGILFPSGTELQPESREVLDEIISFVKKGQYSILVAGYTDDRPVDASVYRSNGDLSIARAGRVLRYMQNKGRVDPKRLSLTGYGSSKPIKRNGSEENKDKNNRVELILLM